MKSSLRWAILLGLSPLLISGCKKKEVPAVEVAREANSKLPAEEQITTPDTPASVAAITPTAGGAPVEADQAAYEAWFKKYHLDLNDPKMLDADSDDDGFSNRDEFLANTNPTDKNVRPGYHKTIRLKEYHEVRLPLVLESIEGDKARIRRTDQPDSKPITVKAGDAIKGLPLKVQHVQSKEDFDKSGDRVDLSNVALEDSATREKILLRKDLPAKTAASFAVLTSPDGKTTLKVHRGESFAWPGEQGTTYKVVDLSQDQVVLQQADTKQMWTIPRQ